MSLKLIREQRDLTYLAYNKLRRTSCEKQLWEASQSSESYSVGTENVLTPAWSLRLFEMHVTTNTETRVGNGGETGKVTHSVKLLVL
jgi:hypothetical protein